MKPNKQFEDQFKKHRELVEAVGDSEDILDSHLTMVLAQYEIDFERVGCDRYSGYESWTFHDKYVEFNLSEGEWFDLGLEWFTDYNKMRDAKRQDDKDAAEQHKAAVEDEIKQHDLAHLKRLKEIYE